MDERSPEALEAFLARLQQKLLRHGSNALAERFGELELVAVFVTSKILDFPTIKQVKRSLLAMEPISDFFEIVFQLVLRVLKVQRNLVQLWIHARPRHDDSLLDCHFVVEGMIEKLEHA